MDYTTGKKKNSRTRGYRIQIFQPSFILLWGFDWIDQALLPLMAGCDAERFGGRVTRGRSVARGRSFTVVKNVAYFVWGPYILYGPHAFCV